MLLNRIALSPSLRLCASSLRVSPGNVCRTFCAPARFHDAKLNVKASPETLKIVSLDTANSAQVVKYNISEAVGKYKSHPTDTGSTSVQVAVLTERIKNLARHFTTHRKDYASNRGFQILLSRRRRLLKYLKRTDINEFGRVVEHMGLQREVK